MRLVSVRMDDLRERVINLGYAGENEHTRVLIDCKTMYELYPTASASLTVSPPSGEPYPAVIVRDGNIIKWDITDSDLIYEGDGEIQLAFTVGEEVGKSPIGRIKINRSIIPTGEIPDPLNDFLTQAGAALTAIPETIDAALGEITAEAEELSPGSSPTASFDAENKVLTIGVPPGEDGHSPVVTASKAGKVTTISVDGTGIATINDGTDGEDGDDGYSPTATVTKSGKVATISITDANGTTTATVSDGDGASDIIDDNAGSGDTDKVWSADKSADLLSQIQQTPELHASSATDVDLDISDEYGYVIQRLKDGHIQTKNFDSSKSPFLEGSDAENVDLDVSDPNGNVIVRVKDGHIKTKYFDSSQAVVVNNANPLSVINDGIGMLACFDTVGCIGDSLASGECPYSGGAIDKYNISWGQIMARMNGNIAYNFSIGGLTTRTWLSRYTGANPTDDSFQEHPCQAYIIALGQNDSYSGDSRYVQLGTTADIGTATDSFYGNMSRIITEIKTLQARAKIFIMTDPYETNETGGYNDAVRYIASHTSDCYLIDLYTYGMNIDPFDRNKSSLWSGGHLVATGYFLSAKIINTYIDWIMKNNLSEFRYIQFIGTEYSY